jgi:hypothetical protein
LVNRFIRKTGVQVLPVVYDEGLYSYKAIAFINGNPKCSSLKTKSYLMLGSSPQSTILSKQKTLSGFSKNLGEKLWIK